ncbi:MAG: oligoribonuclease [Zoogloeaceae bacterium]|jgi:oligoribonuclease|nr:oligoribonuclease [Zoogloeaceae bacterium]
MARDATNLIWLDMEMTGLNPDSDRIIELAIVVTDSNLEVLAESPVWAIRQPEAILKGMDEWNQKTHARSGLIERVRASRFDEAKAEAEACVFVQSFASASTSPMCGNSICQDRRFMARHMPKLEKWFHYRNLDVSTLKELCKRWAPALLKGFQKRGAHEALADIYESIDELKYYREHFIRPLSTVE